VRRISRRIRSTRRLSGSIDSTRSAGLCARTTAAALSAPATVEPARRVRAVVSFRSALFSCVPEIACTNRDSSLSARFLSEPSLSHPSARRLLRDAKSRDASSPREGRLVVRALPAPPTRRPQHAVTPIAWSSSAVGLVTLLPPHSHRRTPPSGGRDHHPCSSDRLGRSTNRTSRRRLCATAWPLLRRRKPSRASIA